MSFGSALFFSVCKYEIKENTLIVGVGEILKVG